MPDIVNPKIRTPSTGRKPIAPTIQLQKHLFFVIKDIIDFTNVCFATTIFYISIIINDIIYYV